MAPKIEGLLLETAAVQHGVIAIHQARPLASRSQLQREFSHERWKVAAPGVFSAVGAPDTEHKRAMVRLLRAGPGAVVSHESALWIWGVDHWAIRDLLHVTRMRGSNGVKLRPEGVVVHETRRMPCAHVTVHRGFPIATPSRALADLTMFHPSARIERLLDRAWTMGLVSYERLAGVLGDLASRGRPYVQKLVRLVEARGPEYTPPESGLEGRLNWILRSHDLPGVRRQVEVGGEQWLGRVDFVLEGTPLIIEAQSDEYHWSLSSRDDDRRRAEAMDAAGFRVVQVSQADIWSAPAEVIAAVEAARRELRD